MKTVNNIARDKAIKRAMMLASKTAKTYSIFHISPNFWLVISYKKDDNKHKSFYLRIN